MGTDAACAPLNHLDLAINMYFDGAASRRRVQTLSGGRVEDASVRTHLLRIDGAPFSSCVEFARQFFQSNVLLSEWIGDQFARTDASSD